MLDIQKKALFSLVAMLQKSGAQFKIILDDGTEYGELEVQVKKICTRKPSLLPRGTLTTFFTPYVSALEVGDVSAIPLSGLDGESLRSSLSSWIHAHWGASGGTTILNKTTNSLEVLRLK
jgi:hypothetical protein